MFVRSNLARCAALVVVGALGLAGCRGGGIEAEPTASARDFIEKRDHRAAPHQPQNALARDPHTPERAGCRGRARGVWVLWVPKLRATSWGPIMGPGTKTTGALTEARVPSLNH